MKDDSMKFLRRHGKVINNVGVVLVVLLAIYVKMNDEGGAAFFKPQDAFIIGGAFLAFLLLYIFKKKKE